MKLLRALRNAVLISLLLWGLLYVKDIPAYVSNGEFWQDYKATWHSVIRRYWTDRPIHTGDPNGHTNSRSP